GCPRTGGWRRSVRGFRSYRVLRFQTLDGVAVVTQFGEDGVGVFAECGHGVHARFGHAGREQGGNYAGGSVDVDPAFTRYQLDVVPEIVHVVEMRVGDGGVVETLDDLVRGQAGEDFDNDGVQFGACFGAANVRGEARVCCESGLSQNLFAEQGPFAFVLEAEHDAFSVTCGERAVRVDGRVRRAGARRGRCAIEGVVERVAHPLGHAFEHG